MDGSLREAALDLPQGLLPRIGGLATMPSRLESLRIALPHILSQVDRLFIYLDQHDAVPAELAGEPKVVTLLPTQESPRLGCSGKLLGLKLQREPCLYYCFDDDIVYGQGYADHLAAALRRYHHRCIVGVHASVYANSVASYIKDKRTLTFNKELPWDVVADELGSGAIAFHSALLELDPREWAGANMTDLHLMIEAVRQKVPRICINHPGGWIKPIALAQPDSIYAKTLADDSAETKLLLSAMANYPGAWCMSPARTQKAS